MMKRENLSRASARSAVRLAALLLLLGPLAGAARAQSNEFRAEYTVEVASTKDHLFHVTTDLKNVEGDAVELALPTWTPGWYTVENYAKNILRFRAVDAAGRPLRHRMTRKQTWSVETGGAKDLRVEFDYFAGALALNQAKIADDYAFFTGTQLFLEPVGRRRSPLTVRFKVPVGWGVITPLGGTADPFVFAAPDYDTLVDTPVEMGRFDVTRFEVEGKPHFFVSTPAGAFPAAKREKLAPMLARIAEAERAVFGELPYEKYVYFYFLAPAETNASGGLEHAGSHVVVGRGPHGLEPEALTGIAAHEFFHTWNVKRLRPAEMFPYDYSREQETPSLWFSEGFTNYYGPLSLYRASLRSREDFLSSVASAAAGVEQNPARQYISPASSSASTWLCYDTPCAFGISYYTQGQNLAALLDLSIRHDSGGARGLDDLMRALYEETYKRGRGFTPEDFITTASRLAGRDYRDFYRRYVEGTEVPPYDQIFGYAGYRLDKTVSRTPYLGVGFNATGQGLEVTSVAPDSGAARAGLLVGDLILKIDGARLRSEHSGTVSLAPALAGKIDQTVRLTVRRGADEKIVEAKVGARETADYKLVEVERPTPEQLKLREGWLKR